MPNDDIELPEGWTDSFVANADFHAFVQAVEAFQYAHAPSRRAERDLDLSSGMKFRSSICLSFPASDIQKARATFDDRDESSWRIELNCFGFLGPAGTLPLHFTGLAQDFGDTDRSALRDFLAVFEHRAAVLHHLGWESSQWLSRWRRACRRGSEDRDLLTRALDGFVGVESASPDALAFARDLLRYYSGAISATRRPAVSLQRILQEQLGVNVVVSPMRGRWQRIEDRLRTKLGTNSGSRFTGEDWRNSRLGRTTFAGKSIWMCQSDFRIRLGPLTRLRFDSLLPEGDLYLAMSQFVQMYGGRHLGFVIQLVLAADEVPRSRLGVASDSRLGWNVWVSTRRSCSDRDDCAIGIRY